jgi:small subunit ribosomal protein S6
LSERTYEIVFIADPNLGDPELDALVALVQGYVEKEGAKVERVEKWGKKRLAYVIKKQREGNYVLMVVEGGAALIKEVERRLRVTDGILRFLTVRVDEELAKAERRKAQRAAEDAKRKARTGGRPPAAPAEPEEVEL